MSDPAGATVVAVVVVAYAIGTFPTAQLVGRRLGFDPTATGSGNPGASNTTRLGGVRAGAVVLAGDAGKGALSAGLGQLVAGGTTAWLAGAAAVAGHMWPATRRFRGGKGVATVAGMGVVCAPVALAGLAAVFVLAVGLSGKAAVGSIAVAVLLPLALLALASEPFEVAVGVALGLAMLVRHRSNIARLLTGTESDVTR